ncbi:CRISPR-associated RAMP protein, Csm3 family [Methanocaldococcus vulcanius M7]|uniref:CRISPR system Cms endoribonuclease Csm3 n=1 Tax=Methanocaldococcus vulcanius (strain ATCC 700851 / DSM 12094 / M7) TaxID=579137 RepID=C9RHF5_METVM|nr:type III-A CRISPR-associated RAMP protein Csm3 [Methanocaldococcus vulcanius]ACX73007.1 CRISPR-associated RAMP protein, Csm3 family [Methanocaldococcus vulcanius M7]
MENNNLTLKGKIILEGNIKLLTGMHIGGTKETLKIGGTDNPVIKDAFDNILIPGSSLKGKIRSLLEKKDGLYKHEKNSYIPCDCGECYICKIFGPHKSDNIKEPTRVIVRDAYLIPKEGKKQYEHLEVKAENIIDRVKGTAQHPRFTERVVKDSEFKFEVVFNVYKKDDIDLIKKFIEGMRLLEDDYLGGSGSRGYGKIKFESLKIVNKPKEYYEGKMKEVEPIPAKDLDDLIKKLNEIWNY